MALPRCTPDPEVFSSILSTYFNGCWWPSILFANHHCCWLALNVCWSKPKFGWAIPILCLLSPFFGKVAPYIRSRNSYVILSLNHINITIVGSLILIIVQKIHMFLSELILFLMAIATKSTCYAKISNFDTVKHGTKTPRGDFLLLSTDFPW